MPREVPRYHSLEKKLIAVPWYAASAAIIAQTAYFIHPRLSEMMKASGGTPSVAMANTAYFMPQSSRLSVEYGWTMSPTSHGRSPFAGTVYLSVCLFTYMATPDSVCTFIVFISCFI